MRLFVLTFGICGLGGLVGDDTALFLGLGEHSRAISTKNADAQRWFDRGLAYLFAFNHDEAVKSFEHAAAADPTNPMPHWGIAIALGPHINNPPVPESRTRKALQAIATAKGLQQAASEIEKDLIAAVAVRFADPPPENRRPQDEAYANAMRELWKKYPADADVGAMFAESVMDLRPWDLWGADGTPRPETPEVVATLEAVLKIAPKHPLALHLQIHALEASPDYKKAEVAADRLRFLQPALGHLVHMPSHIDIRLGRWRDAAEANDRAILADAHYRAKVPQQDFYRLYMAHNQHMLCFAAAMSGQSQRAMRAVASLGKDAPESWLSVPGNAAILDGFAAIPTEVLIRFGKWNEVLAQPEPPVRFPIARAMRLAARGTALAALNRPAEARDALKTFRETYPAIPKEAVVGNNAAADLFVIANKHLEAEIHFREGRLDQAVALLQEALTLEDQLRYDEPPDRFIPIRHTLGAFLLAAQKPEEAEAVYRADLARWPKNGWSLFGLAQALKAQGKTAELAAVEADFKAAWSNADFELTASCLCVPGPKSEPK